MVNVNKMDRFYEDANDQHVRSTFVYTDGTYAYADKELTTKIDGETLMALFLKGEIVLVGEGDADTGVAYNRPVVCAPVSGCVAIGNDGGSLIFSAEYIAD